MKNVISAIRKYVDKGPATWIWWLTGIFSFYLFTRVMAWMESLYLATKHPASVMAGQTTFNGEQIKGFYEVMIEANTLDKYIQVQINDYLLMLTMFLWLFILCAAVYRSMPATFSKLKGFAWTMTWGLPLAPLCDALENAISFIMLANPSSFWNGLALPYSTFAVIKFLLSGMGFVWITLGGLVALVLLTYLRLNKTTESTT